MSASQNQPLMITCAITGAETTKDKQPNLPVTPKEQAQAAYDAIQAGASIIHLHVREDDGTPSQSVDRFKESIDAIRSKSPDAIIQISTGGAIGETVENRAKPLSLKPEMASLNLGTMNFGEDVFFNHPKDILSLASKMQAEGVLPELEIYETGMLESAFRLAKQGVIREPLHFQFVLGVPGGMSGDSRNLIHLLNVLEALSPSQKPHWGVAGIGRFQLPLAILAMTLGGHVRVGFEDNIYYQKGVVAKSNAQLVERVAKIASELGREVLTPKKARTYLGLK